MLAVTQLSGFGVGGAELPPAELAFVALTHDNTDLTTYSFAGQSFGAGDSTRRIIAVFHWNVTNAALTFVSATIGGIAATVHVQATTPAVGATIAQGCLIFSALVPTGTSGTIAITMSGACIRSSIGVYRMVNEINSAPNATMSDIVLSGNVLSGTINVPAVGMLVAGANFAITAGSTNAWVGVTENYDIPHPEAAGTLIAGGHATGLGVETGRTVSATITGTTVRGALAAMSWG